MDVDLDDTACGPFAFLQASNLSGSAIQDDDDDEEGQYEGEMEMTEAIKQNIHRRSLAAARRPLSLIPPVEDSDPPQQDVSYDQDADESQQSYTDDNSARSSTDADASATQPVEYTIPLSKPLNPPAPPDELWFALRKMTHSGDTPHEPQISSDDEGLGHDGGDGMDLDHAVERLMHARSSLPLIEGASESNPDGNRSVDDSFSSLDNSIGENDIGDRTINVSRVFGKASLGGQSGLHSTMDSTNIYGGVLETPEADSTPSPVPAQVEYTQNPPKSSVFSNVVESVPSQTSGPPTSNAPPDQGPEQASVPEPSFSFSPKSTSTAPPTPKNKPSSSSKTKPIPNPPGKQKPTAAFMPPVPRVSPKKRPLSSMEAENDENSESNRPGPTKRMTMANKWAATIGSSTTTESPSVTTIPKPLTPSKKAVFQPPQPQVKPATSSLRRPSGYFARRKSMGVESSVVKEVAGGNDMAAPRKKAALGIGRASVGSEVSGISVDLSRFVEKGKEKVVEEPEVPVPESDQHAAAVPSPKRERRKSKPPIGSPARVLTPQASPEVSRLLVYREDDDTQVKGGDVGMVLKSTEKWRENVQQHDFANDDEGVRLIYFFFLHFVYIHIVMQPPISIEQFFTMTGIRFMDEITAPRRSIHPSQLGPNSRARRASTGETPEIPLAEYATAIAVDVPQLKLYTRVAKDLQAWIAQSKVVYVQAEEEAAKLTPQLFTEYSQANEEGQEQLLVCLFPRSIFLARSGSRLIMRYLQHQLHLMKANSRGLAKSDWYDWKLGWVQGLHTAADKGLVELKAVSHMSSMLYLTIPEYVTQDAKELEKINHLALEILPALEEEHQLVMRELEQEQADVAEIENGDKNYLNELKASITEQK
jgi:kinetochore protein Spc7/SPC105